MANNKNLTPFKKGDKRASECGKKSKRKPLDERLAELAVRLKVKLKDKNGKVIGTITMEDAIERVLLETAAKGEIPFIREYNDRRYGKSKQIIEDVTPHSSPFELSDEEKQFLKENYAGLNSEKNKKPKGRRAIRKKASPSVVAGKKTPRNTQGKKT